MHKSDPNFSVFSHSCNSVQSSYVIQHLASKHQSVTDAKVMAGRRQETGFAHAASTDVRTGIRHWQLLPDAPNTTFFLYLEQHKMHASGPLKFRSDVPDSRTFLVASEVLALATAVGDCTTIVQSRSTLSGPSIVILTSILMKQLDHENPELPVRVIDVDDPGTGRNARTLMRRFADKLSESTVFFLVEKHFY